MIGAQVRVGQVRIGGALPFALIAGPLRLETLDHALFLAEGLARACAATDTPFVFRAGFDKANRLSLGSERGVGLGAGLEILSRVREAFGCPVASDVHDSVQAEAAGEVLDLLQIPASSCDRAGLLAAAGRTGRAVQIDRAPWMAPRTMADVARALAGTEAQLNAGSGNGKGIARILLGDQGAAFGYGARIADMRALPEMAATGYPVVFDATRAVAGCNGRGGPVDGVPVLARAAIAVGISALGVLCHEAPARPGDPALPLDRMAGLLAEWRGYDTLRKAEVAVR